MEKHLPLLVQAECKVNRLVFSQSHLSHLGKASPLFIYFCDIRDALEPIEQLEWKYFAK